MSAHGFPGHDALLDRGRMIAKRWVADDGVAAIALATGTADGGHWSFSAGRRRLADEPGTLPDDAIFVVASITKPIVAMAVLALVEAGEMALGDRVTRFLPNFAGTDGKRSIAVRHLLTHTSGLPDMLPNNRALRERNSPLAAFVEGAAAVGLDFPPGTGVQYQSTGFAVLGEIVHRVTGTPLAEFLRERLLEPLGMSETTLGAPDAWYENGTADRIVDLRVPVDQEEADGWNWNSRYWRQLGAPWGGLLTTPADLGTFARMMLNRGEGPSGRVLSSATIATATRNQLVAFPDVSESDRRCRPWGLGWRLEWPTHAATFGDLVGPATYGHFGATGTLMWIDPDRGTYGIVLTTTPFDPRRVPLARVSNALVSAVTDSRSPTVA